MPFTFDTLFTKLSGIVPVKFVAKLFCISNVLAVSLLEFCLAIDVAFLIEIPLSTAVAIQNRIKNIRILFFFFRVIYNTALLKEPIFLPPCFIIFRNFHNKYFKLCVSHFIYLR